MGRQPCCDKAGLKKGPWTIQEDHKLVSFIINNGVHCWRSVPKLAGLLRCGKSCRLRWINYLRPDLKRGALSQAEEDQIIQLHARLGNRWSKIASHFPGRTDNEIKNIWNTKIKKRLKLVGLDPKTHQPIDENEKEKELEEIKNDIIEETIERDHEFNTIETIETSLKTGGDIKYDSIPFSDSTNTQRGSQAIDLTEFLEEYEMLLFNDETTQSPSFSQNPSIAESSSNTSSKEDLTQQWVESVDSILSWDYFDIFESEFFLFG